MKTISALHMAVDLLLAAVGASAIVGGSLYALAKDAARWNAVKKMFRAMSLDMGGNHTWTLSHFGMLKGPSIDEAADKTIEAAQADKT